MTWLWCSAEIQSPVQAGVMRGSAAGDSSEVPSGDVV